MLSISDKQAYIESDGDHCPYCKNRNIQAIEPLQADETRQVECHDCGALWYDVMSVVDIIEAT